MRWNLTERLKNREKQICAIALVASMLCILGYPLYLYVEVDSPDSNRASVSYLIEFSEICRPSGDDLAQWAPAPSGGGNYVNVDETTVGSDTTTTYNEADATNEKDIYTMSDMAELDRGEYTEIDGVTLWLWAIRGSAGINQLQAGVRISDTDYVGITSATTVSWVNYTYTYTLNPATSAAWTITEINALECYILGVDSAPSHHVSQLAVLVPGRQTCWPPTFTSTPDEDAIVGNAYSYTATANETSTFSLFDSTPSTGPYSIVLRPSADVSSTNFLDVPDTDVYYDKLDETDADSDTTTTRFYTGVTSSQATWYGELTNLPDYDYYDIDIGGWIWMQASGSETDAGGGIQTTPGDTGTNNDIYRGAISTSWLNKSVQWELNPETSVEWTESGVNSLRAYCLDGSYTLAAAFSQFGLLVNYTLVSAVADWFTFTPANATLWGTPDIGDVGYWDVSISAVSASGEGTAWQNFTIHVTEPWVPTFTSSAIENAATGIEYNYSYTTNETCTYDVSFDTGGGGGNGTLGEPGGDSTAWLNDIWAYYKYLDSSASEAYVSGNDVWNYDRIIFFRLDLSSLPDSTTLSTVGIDIYKNYETANGVVDVNRSEAWGGVNGSYSGVWNEAYLKSLTPAGSLAWTGEDDGATGWWNWSDKDMTPWQTQFDTNKTLYFALTGWAYSTSGTSYGFNASTARFDIEYTTLAAEGGDETPLIYQYKTSESSAVQAYVPWDNFDYGTYNLLAFDLSDIPEGSTLDLVGITVEKVYDNTDAGSPVLTLNYSLPFGGTSGGLVRTQANLEALLPSGSYVSSFDGYYGDLGWYYANGSSSVWQSQFDNNGTIYIGFTVSPWSSTYKGSFGQDLTTCNIYVEYSSTPAGSEWLSWDSEDDFIWGTPTGDDGPVDVSIKATNSVGGVTYQNFTVTPGDGWAPTFTSSPDETGSAENLYSYTPTCNETVTWPVDDDFVTNATFLHWGQANNTIYGTPAIEDVGSYYVNISAVSVAGYLTAYQNYTLVISLPDVTDPVAIAAWAQLPTGSLNFTYGYTGFDTVLDGGYSYDDVGIDNYTWALDIDGVPSSNRYGSSFWEIFTVPGLYEWTLTVSDGTNDDYTEFSFTLNQSMVLWPTGDMGGTGGSWSPVGDPNETECIKDPALQVISSPYYDGDDTYIYSTLGVDPYYITFSLDDFYIELSEGQSFNVTVFAWVKELDEGDGIYLGIQDEDTLTETYDIYETTTSWVNYSQTWEENPVTDAPWTTNDINETNLFIWNDLNDNDAVTLAGLFIQISYVDTTDPVANAGPDQSVDTGDTVTFSGAASTDNFGIVNYTWTFTYNSTTVTLYLVGPSYTFEIVGSYVVTLNVSDAAGYWDTDTMTVTVEEIPPNPIEWLTTSGVMLMLGLIGFVGMIAFPVLYIKFRDKGQGNMNGFVAFIIYEMILFGMFFAALLGAG